MIPLSYNFRSLKVRRTSSIATTFGIALVVFVLAGAMMLVAGIERTFAVGGRPDNVIIVGQGADDELNSNIDELATKTVAVQKGVAQVDGQPAVVSETVVVGIVQLLDRSGFTNVLMRGTADNSIPFRPEIRVVKGRLAKPGTDEVMIGQGLEGRFTDLDIGKTFELKRNRRGTIVGVFSAGGSSYESEVWVDGRLLRSVYGRDGIVSSMRVRLTSKGAYTEFATAVQADKRIGLKAFRETDYLEKQTADMTALVGGLGGTVAFFTAIGAMIGAMITMYDSVASRRREIGTLRALGFGRGNILVSFLIEAIVLSIVGGAIGLVAATAMRFVRFSMLGGNWAEVVISFEPTSSILIQAMVAAGVMGLLGGLFPAIRASRISAVAAMRGE